MVVPAVARSVHSRVPAASLDRSTRTKGRIRMGRSDHAHAAATGALAGCVGAVAMVVLMEPSLAGRLGPHWRPTEFVPKQVVRWLERRSGRTLRSEERETTAAVLTHLAYGSLVGAAYGVLRQRTPNPSAAPAGAAWGLLLWAVGYQGWMPALGVRPATTDHPPTQWPVPVANHLLYGTVLSQVYDRIRSGSHSDA